MCTRWELKFISQGLELKAEFRGGTAPRVKARIHGTGVVSLVVCWKPKCFSICFSLVVFKSHVGGSIFCSRCSILNKFYFRNHHGLFQAAVQEAMGGCSLALVWWPASGFAQWKLHQQRQFPVEKGWSIVKPRFVSGRSLCPDGFSCWCGWGGRRLFPGSAEAGELGLSYQIPRVSHRCCKFVEVPPVDTAPITELQHWNCPTWGLFSLKWRITARTWWWCLRGTRQASALLLMSRGQDGLEMYEMAQKSENSGWTCIPCAIAAKAEWLQSPSAGKDGETDACRGPGHWVEARYWSWKHTFIPNNHGIRGTRKALHGASPIAYIWMTTPLQSWGRSVRCAPGGKRSHDGHSHVMYSMLEHIQSNWFGWNGITWNNYG